MATRARAPRGEGDRLREEILDAAESLLAERGVPDAVSMRAIARVVGVSPPAIYLHFADKEELFFECCRRRFDQMAVRMAEAVEGKTSALERLEALGRCYVEFGIERGEQYKVMFLGDIPDAVVDQLEPRDIPGLPALFLVADAVTDGIASGELRPELDPMATAFALWSGVHGAVLVALKLRHDPNFPQVDEQAFIDTAITTTLRGLAA